MKPLRFRDRAESAIVATLTGVTALLPDAAAGGLGAMMGRIFYAVDRSHRRVTVRQLHAAFPVRSVAECRAIARATFSHFGRSFMLLLKFSRLDREGIRRRVDFDGLEHVDAALAQGKGVLLVSGHFGFWEIYALAHPLVISPLSVIARPLDNPLLDRRLDSIRRSTGNNVIYKQGAARKTLRTLESGGMVAALIDQYSSAADAVTVEFFGQPAGTSSTIAALALRTGAPLIPFFALPIEGGRYRVVFEPPVALPPAGAADPVRVLTQRCTDVLEMYVRRYPQLWLWMHRRWRDGSGPAGAEREMFPAGEPDTVGELES